MDGREPLKRQKQEMPGLVRTEALVFEAGGVMMQLPHVEAPFLIWAGLCRGGAIKPVAQGLPFLA